MTIPNNTLRPVTLAVLVVVAALAMTASPAAAQSAPEPAFIVEVQSDGSAEVSVRSTYDLATDSEQDAFRTLMDDEQAQQEATNRFHDRMQAVASDAENATGRQMSVTSASIDLQRTTDDETGVVTLSVSWEGLAAVEGETLVITEPFASGFSTDRPLVLRAPDGYEIATASPTPAGLDDDRASWNAGTDLSGYAVELQAAESPTPTGTDGQPGFGWLVTLLAVLGVTGIAARSRSRG